MKDTCDVDHYPHPVPVLTGEVVGGRAVFEGTEVRIRCGCTHALEHEYGHEKEQEA